MRMRWQQNITIRWSEKTPGCRTPHRKGKGVVHQLPLSLVLSVLVSQVASERIVGQSYKRELPAFYVFAGGWHLDIRSDGSGRIGFGSNFSDNWRFPAGTFDEVRLAAQARSVRHDVTAGIRTHFAIHMYLNSPVGGTRQSVPAVYRQSKDLLSELIETAVAAAGVKQSQRGAMLLEKAPPSRILQSTNGNPDRHAQQDYR